MRWYAALSGVVALGALALGAGDRTPAQATHGNVDVHVLDNSYDAVDAVIHVGDTVTWVNAPLVNIGPHSITECSDGTFSFCAPLMPSSPIEDSGVRSKTGWPYGPIQFTAPGTYYYACSVHGAGMSGRVIVEPLGSPTPIPPQVYPVFGGLAGLTTDTGSGSSDTLLYAALASVLGLFAVGGGLVAVRRRVDR